MKYLKNHPIKESVDSSSIISYLQDIFLELSDKNFNIQIEEKEHHAFDTSVEILLHLNQYDIDFFENTYMDELTPFNFSDVGDSSMSAIDYMFSENFHCYDFSIITYDLLENGNYLSPSKYWGGAYKTSIELNDNNPSETDISDIHSEVLCVYIGFGYEK